jgi:hypothetical protein
MISSNWDIKRESQGAPARVSSILLSLSFFSSSIRSRQASSSSRSVMRHHSGILIVVPHDSQGHDTLRSSLILASFEFMDLRSFIMAGMN